MDVVFSFGGQENWMRIIGGMRHRQVVVVVVVLEPVVLCGAARLCDAVCRCSGLGVWDVECFPWHGVLVPKTRRNRLWRGATPLCANGPVRSVWAPNRTAVPTAATAKRRGQSCFTVPCHG